MNSYILMWSSLLHIVCSYDGVFCLLHGDFLEGPSMKGSHMTLFHSKALAILRIRGFFTSERKS